MSIVDATPGVTRDRVSRVIVVDPPNELVDGEPRMAELLDTGGFGVYVADGRRYDDAGEDLSELTPEIEHQISLATSSADLVLFVVDAHAGPTVLDERIATMLRRSGNPDRVLLVVNKVDGEDWEAHAAEFAAMGLGDILVTSAKSAYRKREFLERLWERIDADAIEDADPEMNLAIVGRRNAGKSTLVNALAGEDRVIVSEIAGTTRDAVDVRVQIGNRTLTVIDTAGVRKKKSWSDNIEAYSHQRTIDSIERADVTLLMLDATEKISQVEKRLGHELQSRFKPVIIVLNKWDLINDDVDIDDFLDYLEQELPGLSYAPIIRISATEKDGVNSVLRMALNLYEQASHRESTGKLNAVFKKILERRGPSSKLGTRAKILYVTQVAVRPPTIALVVNKPQLFKGSYERYIRNRLHEELPYSEIPIRLIFSERRRMDLNALKGGEHRAGHVEDDDNLDDSLHEA